MKHQIEIEIVESGQRAKYGDTFNEVAVTDLSEYPMAGEMLEHIARAIFPTRRVKGSPCHFDSVDVMELTLNGPLNVARLKQRIPSTH